jgi:hypothetical protein
MGPPSLHPPNPPPTIHSFISDQKPKKPTKKASIHLGNNDGTIVASSNNETAQNEAAAEADGAAPGPAKCVTGMIGEFDVISM